MKKYCKLALILVIIAAFACLAACSSASRGTADNQSSLPQSKPGIEGSTGLDYDKLQQSGQYEQKIIRTTTLTGETKKFDEAVALIETRLKDAGGYIEQSSLRGNGTAGDNRTAEYKLRIPADKCEQFTKEIGNTVTVTYSQSNSDEVTAQYYDVAARLEVYKQQKDALQKMYDNYTDYKDIGSLISLQDKLFDVIAQIESLQTQLNLYDNLVDYSTVNLTLREVVSYTDGNSFGQRVQDAFSQSWADFAEGCKSFAVFMVSALPTLLVLAVIGAVIFLIVFLSIRSGRKKRNAKNDNQQ